MDLAVRLNFLKGVGLLLSWALVSFGQPVWSAPLSVCASAFGYALFWWLAPPRFWVATLWFSAVQLVQIQWLASSEYMGPMIFVVYALLSVAMGVQFGLVSFFLKRPLTFWMTLGLSGMWVMMEWARLFLLTGFPWNPVGMSLAGNDFSLQIASLFGIYGLSFWVLWTNLLALRAIFEPRSKGRWIVFGLVASFPYLFGVAHVNYWEAKEATGKMQSIALVQTALMPEEKEYTQSKAAVFVPPAVQWERILSYLQQSGEKRFDLIVLPEGTVPWGANRAAYPYETAKRAWIRQFGPQAIEDFPPLEAPFGKVGHVSNAFWAQSLANHYQSEVIVGLIDSDGESVFNSAFHFQPKQKPITSYAKRVLVPVGEYVPLSGWKPLADIISDQFGIGDSFKAGTVAKLFRGATTMGISICSEETYGHLVREARVAGAEMFVSISNDAWFPETNLPWHHYHHGRVRAVENGVCLLRSCNTGVTGVVDCFGRDVASLPVSEEAGGVLTLKMKGKALPTLYTQYGDLPILLFSLVASSGVLIFRFRKKTLP